MGLQRVFCFFRPRRGYDETTTSLFAFFSPDYFFTSSWFTTHRRTEQTPKIPPPLVIPSSPTLRLLLLLLFLRLTRRMASSSSPEEVVVVEEGQGSHFQNSFPPYDSPLHQQPVPPSSFSEGDFLILHSSVSASHRTRVVSASTLGISSCTERSPPFHVSSTDVE